MSLCIKKRVTSASAKDIPFTVGSGSPSPSPLNILINKVLFPTSNKNNAADKKQASAENLIDKSAINKNFTLVVHGDTEI